MAQVAQLKAEYEGEALKAFSAAPHEQETLNMVRPGPAFAFLQALVSSASWQRVLWHRRCF